MGHVDLDMIPAKRCALGCDMHSSGTRMACAVTQQPTLGKQPGCSASFSISLARPAMRPYPR